MWRLSEQAQALLQQLHDLLSATSRVERAKRKESIIVLLDRITSQPTNNTLVMLIAQNTSWAFVGSSSYCSKAPISASSGNASLANRMSLA
jgi:hypothetical protein